MDNNKYRAKEQYMVQIYEVNGQTITVRTIVLYDENGNMLTKDDFLHKTIDVTGIIDFFAGEYQIKVFTTGEIVVHD